MRKDNFGKLPGGTTFSSSALTGTVQTFIKLARTYRDPFPFNAVYTGVGNIGPSTNLAGRVESGDILFIKDDVEVEIMNYPWEI